MRVALVHDFLTQFGGAERTLKAIHEIWPEAPIFTALYDPAKMDQHFGGAVIHRPRWSSWPLVRQFYKAFSFFYPLVFESFNLKDFEVVISSSSAFAKGVITNPWQLHICYCYTPPRFLYHYPTETDLRNNPFWRVILAPLDQYLRIWDFWASQRVDKLVAISETIKERVKKFYGRDSTVIYPPVEKWEVGGEKCETEIGSETSRYQDNQDNQKISLQYPTSHLPPPTSYFLVVSRLAKYKNIDLAIKACNQLGLSLKVIGVGREERYLKKMAGSTIEFFGEVNDELLAEFYRSCQAVIVPTSDEDFGLVPVEANSFGKPVIALRSGGLKEVVIEGETGIFFEEPTVESLMQVLSAWDTSRKWDTDYLKRWAAKFSKERFQEEFKEFVERQWEKLKSQRF